VVTVGFFVVVSLIIARKRVHLDLSTAVFASMVGLVGLVIHCLGMRLIAGGGVVDSWWVDLYAV
jgi:hypothetical protein